MLEQRVVLRDESRARMLLNSYRPFWFKCIEVLGGKGGRCCRVNNPIQRGRELALRFQWHAFLYSDVHQLIIYFFFFTELECTIWFSWPRIRSLVRQALVSRTLLELFIVFQCPESYWLPLLGSPRSSVSSARSDIAGLQCPVLARISQIVGVQCFLGSSWCPVLGFSSLQSFLGSIWPSLLVRI